MIAVAEHGGAVPTDTFARARELLSTREFPTDADRDFCGRVFATPEEVYARRLRAIGFADGGDVLDAGCGYGQWTVALAATHRSVTAVDVDPFRVALVNELSRELRLAMVRADVGSLEALPCAAGSMDGIFCYGALFFTDWRRAFREFARVLRPGGRLYFCANGAGWYLYNLIENHKPSKGFSPRRMALATFVHTARFALRGTPPPGGGQLVIPPGIAVRDLRRHGFDVLDVAGDGQIGGDPQARSFFPARKYGLTNVYEVLCQRA